MREVGRCLVWVRVWVTTWREGLGCPDDTRPAFDEIVCIYGVGYRTGCMAGSRTGMYRLRDVR